MRAGERWTCWAGLLAAGVLLLSSGVAYAEPGVSTPRVPWLWLGAVIEAQSIEEKSSIAIVDQWQSFFEAARE